MSDETKEPKASESEVQVRTPATEDESKELALKIQRMQLELLEHQLDAERNKRLQKTARHEQVERDLQDAIRSQAAAQNRCRHKKGGRGNLEQGSDGNYSVIKHQLPSGSFLILCTRCQKEWRPGDPDYQAMIDCESDNIPSASSQFRFTDNATGRMVDPYARGFNPDDYKPKQ